MATDVKDASIFENDPNNSNGAGPAFFAGTDGTGAALRGLIKFDIADNVPAGSTIFGVQLELFLGKVAGSGGGGPLGPPSVSIELHKLSATWLEGSTGSGTTQIGGTGQGFPANPGDATWLASSYPNTLWNNPGGDFAATASATATIGTTMNAGTTWGSTALLVSDVQGWLDSPTTNDGWALVNTDETDLRTLRGFWSKESSVPALWPELTVTYARLAGDVNNDGIVNGQDIAVIASNWLHTGTGANDPAGDANFDGIVNGQDIALLASHWLQTYSGGLAAPEPATFGMASSAIAAWLAGLACHRRSSRAANW